MRNNWNQMCDNWDLCERGPSVLNCSVGAKCSVIQFLRAYQYNISSQLFTQTDLSCNIFYCSSKWSKAEMVKLLPSLPFMKIHIRKTNLRQESIPAQKNFPVGKKIFFFSSKFTLQDYTFTQGSCLCLWHFKVLPISKT